MGFGFVLLWKISKMPQTSAILKKKDIGLWGEKSGEQTTFGGGGGEAHNIISERDP